MFIASMSIYFIKNPYISYPKELVTIDSICNNNPQKAETLLIKYKNSKEMNDGAEWYCRFIAMKSNIKQYKDVSINESLAILKHYEYENNKKMLQEAYYYTGCTYHILGYTPQAIKYFQKGLSIINNTKETEQLRALYYYMLGGVLTYQHLDKEAKSFFTKAIYIHKKQRNKSRLISDYIAISWSYSALNNNKKSIEFLNAAKTEAKTINDRKLISQINSQLAERYYCLKEYKKARRYIEAALAIPDTNNYSAIYNIAAKIYHAIGNDTKAKEYSMKIISIGETDAKRDAYKYLASYYEKKKDLVNANKYYILYGNTTDTVIQKSASEYSAQANAAFNYKYVIENMNILKKNSGHKNIAIITLLFILVCVTVYYITYYYKLRKRQIYLHKILEKNYFEFQEEIESKKKEINNIKTKLEAKKQENDNLKSLYKKKTIQLDYMLKKENLLNKINISNESILQDTNIYIYLHTLCTKRSKINENTIDWIILEETLFNIYPTFKDGLKRFKKMRTQAYNICLLIKAGFNVQEISYLTMKSDEAINSTRRRLYETNFGKKGKPSEWDKIIKSM